MMTNKFTKKERIVSRKLIEQMFGSRHRSAVAFPIRIVYTCVEARKGSAPVEVLISVGKRHLKHAVDRNRVKRLIREAYRRNKHIIYNSDKEKAAESLSQQHIAIAFIWLADTTKSYDVVEQSVKKLLTQTADRLYNERSIEKS